MVNRKGYQLHLSKGDTVLKDTEGRTLKFKKIFSVLQDFRPVDKSLKCLDIGCSSGIITFLLGEQYSSAIGFDIDREAVIYAQKHHSSSRNHFLVADAMHMPFKNGSFDAIICNHIYEHVPDPPQLLDEIFRVLKMDGFCYFSAGNRYMIIEGHYRLPFLSWFPKPIAHLYLRLSGKGRYYYEDHLSLKGLKGLMQKFQIHDYTLMIIRDPGRFFATDVIRTETWLYRWICALAPILYRWIPTYIWVLTKK